MFRFPFSLINFIKTASTWDFLSLISCKRARARAQLVCQSWSNVFEVALRAHLRACFCLPHYHQRQQARRHILTPTHPQTHTHTHTKAHVIDGFLSNHGHFKLLCPLSPVSGENPRISKPSACYLLDLCVLYSLSIGLFKAFPLPRTAGIFSSYRWECNVIESCKNMGFSHDNNIM